MKRYAAVKVPQKASRPLGAGCCGRGARAGALFGFGPLGPSLIFFLSRPGASWARPVGHFPCLPRKEVIQPHLPVRLPCYDFTPLTLHTFDASAPCGFGRRLRVQTTRVV